GHRGRVYGPPCPCAALVEFVRMASAADVSRDSIPTPSTRPCGADIPVRDCPEKARHTQTGGGHRAYRSPAWPARAVRARPRTDFEKGTSPRGQTFLPAFPSRRDSGRIASGPLVYA